MMHPIYYGTKRYGYKQCHVLEVCDMVLWDSTGHNNEVKVITTLNAINYATKLECGTWVLHKEDGPALTTKMEGILHYFFLKGINCSIEDLPCDDITKMHLLLKYTLSHDGSDYSYRHYE